MHANDNNGWGEDRVRRWSNVRTIDLTTYGRRTGDAHRIEIWWFHFEDRFIVTGTPGPRDWLSNVARRPQVVVHVAGEDVEAIARPVGDAAFRRRFFEHGAASWYSSQAELEELVRSSPMVELVPR